MIKNIYSKLLQKYGAQGWWPVTPIGSCSGDPYTPVYGVMSKNDKQRLEVIFGAILTQSVAWTNVEKAIINLNKEELINIDEILNIDEKRLGEVIKPSGYYNQKAKKLKNICKFLKENSIDKLRDMELGELRPLLLGINGIGPETADSILLYAFDKPIFVVDEYTKRFLIKLEIIDESATYDEIQKLFMDELEPDTALFNEFHALIVKDSKKSEV